MNLAPLDHIVVTASSNISASSIIDTSPASAQAVFSRFLSTFYILRQVSSVIRFTTLYLAVVVDLVGYGVGNPTWKY